MNKKVDILSFPKALAIGLFVFAESAGRMTTTQLPEKMRRDATKSHPSAFRNLDKGAVIVQSKVIQKRLHIEVLVFFTKLPSN
ncbi:hypothetical protein [Psychrobacillus sp. L3]|uniref:hypothetical protein n=1 Tax=Psychrobacillus sp. L3 TaxID=3236891 RepID=UPI0036F37413